MKHEDIAQKVTHLKEEIAKVIVGQQTVIEDMLQAILAGGHCLMMGVPGLAKTLLVQTLSNVTHLSFKRVQFTPDPEEDGEYEIEIRMFGGNTETLYVDVGDDDDDDGD